MPPVEGLQEAQKRQDNSGNRRRRKWCLLSRAASGVCPDGIMLDSRHFPHLVHQLELRVRNHQLPAPGRSRPRHDRSFSLPPLPLEPNLAP